MRSWYCSPGARDWIAPAPAHDASAFHRSLPGYAPTLLVDLPELAGEFGVGHVFVKDESSRLGLPGFKVLGASWACRQVLERHPGARLVTASNGNHGRAVARMAAHFGVEATVFLPALTPKETAARIAEEGAATVRVDGDYDAAVRRAAEFADDRPGRALVQDTSWDGYEQVPGWIVEGYETLLEEIDDVLVDRPPDLVVVPVGVGSLAEAVVRHHRRPKAPHPSLLSVEPDTAACLLASLIADRRVTVATSPTIVAGLNAGTVSCAAWPLLRAGIDAACRVGDHAAQAASAQLARLGVSAGPCSGAALAGARAVLTDPERAGRLGLSHSAVVVLLCTDGQDGGPAARRGPPPLAPSSTTRFAFDDHHRSDHDSDHDSKERPGMPDDLQDKLTQLGTELGVPGAAAAVFLDGEETYAFHGVTSTENPLPVDEHTLFQLGSITKTFTATALLRLVEEGVVDPEGPVCQYVPELALKDTDAAERVTVLQLFNHTAGWDGDLIIDTGDGDDALATYVARMATIEQVSSPGATVSYNNASLSLAGRLIENVTAKPYERAMRELVLDPLGLETTLFFANDVMTHRFAVGHTRHDDGTTTVNRPWAVPRCAHPAGGLSAPVADQMAWARFHLGDRRAMDGTPLLSEETLQRMQQPTADMRGSSLGDFVGISWLLRDLDGERLVTHGGATNGQYSELIMVPARRFAVVSTANCGPNGSELNRALTAWTLRHYLALEESVPELLVLEDDALAPYTGMYETIAGVGTISAADGRLVVQTKLKPEVAALLGGVADAPPVHLVLLAGEHDRYLVPEGPGQGARGYFTRDAGGRVNGIHFEGRFATRLAPPAEGS